MNVMPFVRKENPDLPDSYGMTVTLLTGKATTYEVASHILATDIVAAFWEIKTTEDKMVVIPMSSIASVEFDVRWSKMVAVREAEKQKREEVEKRMRENGDHKN